MSLNVTSCKELVSGWIRLRLMEGVDMGRGIRITRVRDDRFVPADSGRVTHSLQTSIWQQNVVFARNFSTVTRFLPRMVHYRAIFRAKLFDRVAVREWCTLKPQDLANS